MSAPQVKTRPQGAPTAGTKSNDNPKPKGLPAPHRLDPTPDIKTGATKRQTTSKAKTRKIIDTAQDVQIVDLAKLHISELNMRHGTPNPDIADIYPSILATGVNQSLLVRKEGKGFGVIAGRRRWFGLTRKAEETGKSVTAPCIVMASGDDIAAREASLLENVARLPSTELEQYSAFKSLSEEGATAADIAATFGLTELRVRRVLALVNVHPDILALYEADKLGRESLRYMTMATAEQQAAWLKLWHSEDYAPQHGYLKEWLAGGTPIATRSALFDLDSYSGNITADLFGREEGCGYFQDADLFWEYQNRAIADRVRVLKDDGWNSVSVMDRGESLDTWDFGSRDKDAGGKVFIEVGHDGSVRIREGLLAKKDIKRIDAILGTGDGNDGAAKAATAKPEMSGPVTEYVRLHRHAATTATLLNHPSVALRLVVTHMLVGSYRWTVEPQKTTSRKESTTDSVAQSQGAVRVAKERQAVFDLLGLTAPEAYYGTPSRLATNDFAQVFASLLTQDDVTVMRVLTMAMSQTLCADEDIVEAVALAIKPDMPTLWTPDNAFFDILRDKRVINAMVSEIGGKRMADSMVSETGMKQKTALRNRMEASVVGKDAAKPDWSPRWMQTVPIHYLDRSTCPPASAAASLAKHFSGSEHGTKSKPKSKKTVKASAA